MSSGRNAVTKKPRKKFRTDAERQTERRVNFRMRGLNTQGKPYGRHPNFVNRAETDPRYLAFMQKQRRKYNLARKLARYHRIAAGFKALGLTTRGQTRRRGYHKRGIILLTPLETEYRRLAYAS